MTLPQIVILLYQIEDVRNSDDNGWESGEHLQGVYGNGSNAVIKWLKRTRCEQLAKNRPQYQFRARKTTYNLKQVWEIEAAERKDNARWRTMERYRMEEHKVRT